MNNTAFTLMECRLREYGTDFKFSSSMTFSPFINIILRNTKSSVWVQFSHSVMFDSLRPHEAQHTRPLYPSPTCRSLPKPVSIDLVMSPSHLILCRPLFLLPSVFPSIRFFSNESVWDNLSIPGCGTKIPQLCGAPSYQGHLRSELQPFTTPGGVIQISLYE